MSAREAGAAGQAAYEEPPLVYDRWCHVDDPEITEDELAGMWNGESPAEREFWRSLVPREAAAQAVVAAAAATPEQVLTALAAVLFESDEPAEDRARRAVEILERNGTGYRGKITAAAAAQPAPGDDVRGRMLDLAARIEEPPGPTTAPSWSPVTATFIAAKIREALNGAQPAPEPGAPALGTAWRLLNELRDALRQLAGECAAATEDDKVDGHVPGSLYMALRAEVLHDAAARIGKLLEGK